MLLAYADESYRKDRFFIVAVIATPEQVKNLSESLDAYVAQVSARHPAVASRAELHGYEIFHGKAEWSSLAPRQRVKVFLDVFERIADSGVRIVIRGLDVEAQRQRYAVPFSPYSVVLTKIMEKLQSLANRDDDLALLICDEYHEDDRHRQLLSEYRRWSTPTSRPMQLDRIIDTIHFTPSHQSRLIQASDMIAFTRLRREGRERRDGREQKALDALWALIRSSIEVDYLWRP